MASGLPVSDVIQVDIQSQPQAVLGRNFGTMLVAGDSPVIDLGELIREYSGLEGVAGDFGVDAPEYQAARVWFSQVPRPSRLLVGRLASVATAGVLHGGPMPAALRDITLYQAITDGSLSIQVDGITRRLVDVNLSAALNLNGVASALTAALAGAAVVTWDASYSRFDVVSATTGAASGVGYGAPAGVGTDLSDLLGFTALAGAAVPVPGSAAKSLPASVLDLADHSRAWYGLAIATRNEPAVNDLLSVAAFVEASESARMFSVTVTSPDVLDPNNNQDFASLAKARGFRKTAVQYSSTNAYACMSLFARMFSVDFTGSRTASTAKFKQQPGVIPEALRVSQARTLEAKNCNVYVAFQNGVAITQQGVMSNGLFFDEVHGLDWLKDTIETLLFNLHYQSTTKIPQTDEGATQLLTETEKGLEMGRTNGFLAPGVWNADPFGYLKRGQALPKGYYTYCAPIAEQMQNEREARRAPLIQAALKLAGAFHSAHVILNVNR